MQFFLFNVKITKQKWDNFEKLKQIFADVTITLTIQWKTISFNEVSWKKKFLLQPNGRHKNDLFTH